MTFIPLFFSFSIIAAFAFTAITVGYCCWGGMRGSLVTDVAQAIMFAALLLVGIIGLKLTVA